MKLISMTSFVLEQNKILETYVNHLRRPLFERCVNYAKFLKQPLTIGMFVPCDYNLNILEEPIFHEPNCENEIGNYEKLIDEYYEAKEKVLFENIPIAQAKWLVNTFSTIESLSDISNTITQIYLTESAIKQIGL